MITIKQGSIFDSQCDMLVNPVNCVGVMGKGLAKEFKARYPKMFVQYREWCKSGCANIGNCHLYIQRRLAILCFPTKYHWRDNSSSIKIRKGLEHFTFKGYQESLIFMGIKSVAFPALGCGEGHMHWEKVKELMLEYLEPLTLEIEIYEPLTTKGD